MNKGTKTFLAYGHAEIHRLQLYKYLLSLGLVVVDLDDQDDLGLTVVEKFEHYAQQCSLAVVLMTPDDLVVSGSDNEGRARSRQNVMIELGWFMRHVGRRRVIIVAQTDTYIPSDLAGILTLRFSKDPREVGERIRQRLEGLQE